MIFELFELMFFTLTFIKTMEIFPVLLRQYPFKLLVYNLIAKLFYSYFEERMGDVNTMWAK